MIQTMTQVKDTAGAHMQRDLGAEGKWVCVCEACRELRSLIGVEKVLDVRPLVRRLRQIEEQLGGLPEGPEVRALRRQYLQLHDRLADVMAR